MTLPLIISIPHCSSNIPEDIRESLALDDSQIIESVDFGTEEIFDALPSVKTIKAQWSRLLVDLNRAPGQTDNKGVTALTDYHGRSIYQPGMNPNHDTIAARVTQYHRPYHEKLEGALANASAVGLIDGHSLNGTGPQDAPDPGIRRKDIIISNIGDLSGAPRPGGGPTSCSVDLIQKFKQAFMDQGFSVSLNYPYEGGYIIKHYGPKLVEQGRFAIQIEMNQDLYMHPGDLEPDMGLIPRVTQRVLRALDKI